MEPEEAGRLCGLSRTAAYEWHNRYEEEGIEGLRDRPRRALSIRARAAVAFGIGFTRLNHYPLYRLRHSAPPRRTETSCGRPRGASVSLSTREAHARRNRVKRRHLYSVPATTDDTGPPRPEPTVRSRISWQSKEFRTARLAAPDQPLSGGRNPGVNFRFPSVDAPLGGKRKLRDCRGA
jgi:hypothetical protein